MKVSCPTCQKAIEWSEDSPFRPFCSERCKLIDLGEWASGGHAIPGEPVLNTEDLDGTEHDYPWPEP
jgi:endogenous inhibitor of DNA gyrase (YacG/DUF329 family)